MFNSVNFKISGINWIWPLIFINIKGLDPISILVPVLFLVNYKQVCCLCSLGMKRHFISLCLFVSLLAYLVSMFAGDYDITFVANLTVNILLALLIVAHIVYGGKIGQTIKLCTYYFVLTNIIAVAQFKGLIPISEIQFDVVRDNRFMGLYGDPNILGAFSASLLLYWINVFFAKKFLTISSIYFELITLFFLALVLVSTLSRSAWLGFFVAMLIYIAMLIRSRKIDQLSLKLRYLLYLGLVLFLFSFLTGAAGVLIERMEMMTTATSDAESDRFALYYTRSAIELSMLNPLGVGPGMTSRATGNTSLDGDLIGSHNAFVQIFSDNGWILGIVFTMAVAKMIFTSIGNGFSNRYVGGVDSRGFAAIFLCILICAMFQDLIQWNLMWIFPSIYIGLVIKDFLQRKKIV